MQRLNFSPGGFALHKIRTRLNHRTHCSAWYDKDGILVDAELILADGTSRPVRRDAGMWHELQQIGYQKCPVGHAISSQRFGTGYEYETD